MQASFYAQVFSREGLSVIVPNQSEQNYIHRIYIEELLKGVVLPETREGLTEAEVIEQEKVLIDVFLAQLSWPCETREMNLLSYVCGMQIWHLYKLDLKIKNLIYTIRLKVLKIYQIKIIN